MEHTKNDNAQLAQKQYLQLIDYTLKTDTRVIPHNATSTNMHMGVFMQLDCVMRGRFRLQIADT